MTKMVSGPEGILLLDLIVPFDGGLETLDRVVQSPNNTPGGLIPLVVDGPENMIAEGKTERVPGSRWDLIHTLYGVCKGSSH